MLADLIAGILRLIKKGEYELASRTLDKIYLDLLKQDSAIFKNIPKNNLTEDLLTDHNYTNDHLEVISELFYAQAELLFAQGKLHDSIEYYDKSLILLKFIAGKSKTFSLEKQSKILLIQNKLDSLKNDGHL